MNEPITADLSGQTTVILGGTGNIGEGIVRAHIAAGATVVVPSRDADRIEVVRQALDGAPTASSGSKATPRPSTA